MILAQMLQDVVFRRPEWLLIGLIVMAFAFIIIMLPTKGVHWWTKIGMTISRLLIIGLLFVAVADPILTEFDSTIKTVNMDVLYDNSTSMTVFDMSLNEVSAAIPVQTQSSFIANGDSSPLLSQIQAKLSSYGLYFLVTDGQATDGVAFSDIAVQAQQLNATIFSLELDNNHKDAGVIIAGPQKTIAGALNKYIIEVTGNNKLPGELVVTIDGVEELRTNNLEEPHVIQRRYNDQSIHTIKATIDMEDSFIQNNEYFLTTRVVPKPKALYLGGDGEVEQFLSSVFDVESSFSLPNNLDDFHVVVAQNRDAQAFDSPQLEEFIAEGNGLVLMGGANAFDFGGYDKSSVAPLIPVKAGRTGNKARATIVFVVDISFSSSNDVNELARGIAYNVIKDLDGQNLVGVVAYEEQPYVISELTLLGQGRNLLLDKLSRLDNQPKGTRHAQGLGGAYDLLKDQTGTRSIVFVTDGQASSDQDGVDTYAWARRFKDEGITFFSVGVGPDQQVDDARLRGIAKTAGGQFIRARETDKLIIEFGKDTPEEARLKSFTMSIFDDAHVITNGLSNPEAQLSNVNAVVPKSGAKTLVLTSQGDVALTVWNYGLGRVAAWTAYTGLDEQGNMLSEPSSLLMTRFLTWAAGDPERKNPQLISIDDGLVGLPTRVLVHTKSLEALAGQINASKEELFNLQLRNIETDTYEGRFIPQAQGVQQRFGTRYAVNYPLEFVDTGQLDVIKELSESTGGKHLKLQELDQLPELVSEHVAQSRRSVSYAWVVILFALVLFVLEVLVRKSVQRFTQT